MNSPLEHDFEGFHFPETINEEAQKTTLKIIGMSFKYI